MSPPHENHGEDEWAWGAEPNRKFSIKTAYNLIASEDCIPDTNQNLWKSTWRWRGPNRVRHFLWLVGHDRLLTNDQRTRWKLTAVPHCPRCPGQIENSIHILRDCSFAVSVWNELSNFDKTEACWSENLESWITKLLRSETSL
ncbi:Putative ribonuclease H protein At1g65750 [Linum perenne]